MKNYILFGPVALRISSRLLAPWGYERIKIGGLSLFTRTSAGDLSIASYHPGGQSTWNWSLTLMHWGTSNTWVARSKIRRGQWHDYYRLPFGYSLCLSRQDYHRLNRES